MINGQKFETFLNETRDKMKYQMSILQQLELEMAAPQKEHKLKPGTAFPARKYDSKDPILISATILYHNKIDVFLNS